MTYVQWHYHLGNIITKLSSICKKNCKGKTSDKYQKIMKQLLMNLSIVIIKQDEETREVIMNWSKYFENGSSVLQQFNKLDYNPLDYNSVHWKTKCREHYIKWNQKHQKKFKRKLIPHDDQLQEWYLWKIFSVCYFSRMIFFSDSLFSLFSSLWDCFFFI